MNLRSIVFVLIIIVSVFNSCTTKEDRIENVQEKVLDVKEDLKKAQEEFVNESEKRIEENRLKIDELRIKIANSDIKLREEYLIRVNRLEQKNAELRTKLKDYREVGKDKWEEFKREFNHDLDEFGKALKDLVIDNKN